MEDTMSSTAAIENMDVDTLLKDDNDKKIAAVSTYDMNEIQLPWVEKYRPQRYVDRDNTFPAVVSLADL